MVKDLRYFLKKLGDSHLVRIKREVSPELEVTKILAKFELLGEYPAVLFEKIRGSKLPVLTNVFADLKRIALALETTEQKLLEDYVKLMEKPIQPKLVSSGPIYSKFYKYEDVDLYKLPLIKHYEKDAGPYITAGCVIMKHPEEGFTNLGLYRLMVKNKKKLGIQLATTSHAYMIRQEAERLNRELEVAIVVGHHPALYISAVAITPFGTNEYCYAGGLLREPLIVTKAKEVDLDVPAYGEIVIEGVIPPHVREEEGPFAEYTGLYSPKGLESIVKVRSVGMREDPIYMDIFSGARRDTLLLGMIARMYMVYKVVKTVCPSVRDIWLPLSGLCRFICYISMRKIVEGEAKNAIMAAFAANPFLKYVVVVDEDVDIRRDEEVLKAIALRVRPDRDIVMIPDVKSSPLDPVAEHGVTYKVGIDATRPRGYKEEAKIKVDDVKLEDYLGN